MPAAVAAAKTPVQRCLLTGLDGITSFAGAAALHDPNSVEVARVFFEQFVGTFGLPKMIVLDAGSEFAGTLAAMCKALEIEYYLVTKENHRAIAVERFHRYMNKVQKLHAMDCESFDDWLIGSVFAVYAWNAAPIEGTNIIRSFAAIGREFPFPIDIQLDPQVLVDTGNRGVQATRHVEGTFPLLFKQPQTPNPKPLILNKKLQFIKS